MRKLTVDLSDHSYEIHIAREMMRRPEFLAPLLSSRSVAIVTNTTVGAIYLEILRKTLLELNIHPLEIVLPDGEVFKNWETLNQIFDALMKAHCERNTVLVALGGGVVGDMGGFAAACYQRGMPFIQVPTTLLAQVDSSVGGKTAINHPMGKNMIGAFYQPRLVLADIDALDTLPDRELSAGLAEVIKYGLIRDLTFLEWLETRMTALRSRDKSFLEEAIYRSCRNKAEVVAADERESGERALLNFGHTFGHAIEAGLGYGVWLHGEAVAAGMVMASRLSCRKGWISGADVERVESVLTAAGLPIRAPALGAERYLALMRHDKKVLDGRLRFVLLRAIGQVIVSDALEENEILAVIEASCAC